MPDDAVTVAPHAYTVAVENDKVRVLESRMQPGEKTALHSHPALIAIAINDCKVRFTSPGEEPMEVDVPAATPMDFPAVDHETENIGDNEALVFLIELK